MNKSYNIYSKEKIKLSMHYFLSELVASGMRDKFYLISINPIKCAYKVLYQYKNK